MFGYTASLSLTLCPWPRAGAESRMSHTFGSFCSFFGKSVYSVAIIGLCSINPSKPLLWFTLNLKNLKKTKFGKWNHHTSWHVCVPFRAAQSVAKWNWHRRHKIRESESRDGLQEAGREKGGLPLVFPKLVFRVQIDLPKQSLASRTPGCVNANQNSFSMRRPGFQARKLRES